MAWDDHAKKLAVKAIGTVESGLKYDSINYNDPITVGIGQWFGTRAAALLNRMRTEQPSKWTGVATSLNSDLSSRSSSANYWTGRYLSRVEGESLRSVLNANAAIQNTQIVSDLEDYAGTAGSYGLSSENNTPTFIMWCSAYHQSPRRALRILSNTGGGVTIERMLAAILNESVLGQYRTRYNTVYNIVKSGDDSGIDLGDGNVNPTEPSATGGDGSGEVADSTQRETAGIKFVEPFGNAIRIHMKDSTVIAQPTPSGRFIVSNDTSGVAVPGATPDNDSNVSPPTSNTGDAASKRAAVVKWMTDRIGRFYYTNSPNRNDPDKTGGGDCSSTIRRAYLDCLGIDIGQRSIDQERSSLRKVIARGNGLSRFPSSSLLPGDVISMALTGTGIASHVEMFSHFSGTTPICIGHGGTPPMGPNEHTLTASWLIGSAYPWQINRFIN